MTQALKPAFQIVTDCRDLANRRIRSFVASVGGEYKLRRDADAFFQEIDTKTTGLIVVDSAVLTSLEQLHRLKDVKAATVICDPQGKFAQTGNGKWNVAVYTRASINDLFESQFARTHFSKLLFSDHSIPMQGHLAWGSAHLDLDFRDWRLEPLLKKLKRRLFMGDVCYQPTQAFLHSLEKACTAQNLVPTHIQFSSDGVLGVTTVTIESPCDLTKIALVTDHLRDGQVVINQLEDQIVEIAFITKLTGTTVQPDWMGVTLILNQSGKQAGGDRPKVYRLNFERAG